MKKKNKKIKRRKNIVHVDENREVGGNNQMQTEASEQKEDQAQDDQQPNGFKVINPNVSILRGTFHQGSDRFSCDSRDKQCTGIAAVACGAFSISDPNIWNGKDIDEIVISGDKYYSQCISARAEPDSSGKNLEYLTTRELLPQLSYNDCLLSLNIKHNMSIDGHIDNDESIDGFPNLINALVNFFDMYNYGILTANSWSVAIASKTEYYWLLDSHARGAKGHKAPSTGVSCCMRFVNIEDLYKIIHRNMRVAKCPKDYVNMYSITPISIMREDIVQSHKITSDKVLDSVPNTSTDFLVPNISLGVDR